MSKFPANNIYQQWQWKKETYRCTLLKLVLSLKNCLWSNFIHNDVQKLIKTRL